MKDTQPTKQPHERGVRRRNAAYAAGELELWPGGPIAPAADATRAASPEALREETARFAADVGAQAGKAARRAQLSAQIPRMAGEQEGPLWPGGPSGVYGQGVIGRAADATGVPRGYLDALIEQESGGDIEAANPNSSARGHTQFIDTTWLSMMKLYGPRYGLDRGERDIPAGDILDLRHDRQWAALMGAEYARQNALALRQALRRDPTEGEVYLAHFASPEVAARLIQAADEDRRRGGRARPATDFVSREAAEANRPVFYDGERARGVGEMVGLQTRKFANTTFALGERGF